MDDIVDAVIAPNHPRLGRRDPAAQHKALLEAGLTDEFVAIRKQISSAYWADPDSVGRLANMAAFEMDIDIQRARNLLRQLIVAASRAVLAIDDLQEQLDRHNA